MSNELIISSANQLPDYLREIGYVDEGLADGIAIRSPKLSVTTAKEFTITKEGKTQVLEQRTIRVVLIASSNTLTKAWYEKAFVPGSTEAPDCFSNDGKVPAAGVAKPQHSNCAGCPKNAFGSHPTTGRGKACGDRKLIVCVWEGDPDTLMTFNAPTMTLSNLAKLNSELKSANVPLQAVLVELSFDPSITYPVVKLNAVGFVDKASLLRFKSLADSDEVKSMLREVDYEPATESAPVVPQNTIQFGSAGKSAPETDGATATAVDPAAAQIAALQAQLAALNKPAEPSPEELAKKQLEALQAQLKAKQEAEAVLAKQLEAEKAALEAKRAAAEQEAARAAAEAAAKPKTEAELLQEQIAALTAQLSGAQTAPTQNLLQSISSSQQQSTVAAPEPEKRKRRTKAEMEAERAQRAASGTPTATVAIETAPVKDEPEAQTSVLTGTVEPQDTAAPTGTSGAPDVLALLKKWQS